MLIQKNQGIKTYQRKGIGINKRKSKSKIQPSINLNSINGWYVEGKFERTGLRSGINRSDHIHYFYQALLPICHGRNIEPYERLKQPSNFALQNRKCKICLRVLSTYSDLSLRVLE